MGYTFKSESKLPYLVTSAFEQFYQTINLGDNYRDLSNKRKEHLISLLKRSFSIIDSFAMGSIPKFTAIKDHADLDIMIVLHDSHIVKRQPVQVLQEIRDAIAYKTNVRKNGQAVTLYYNSWPNVDIVPVSRSLDSAGNISHYNVPNANTGGWITSQPRLHANQIEAKASECGENFRRIIKMIKWWNIIHGNFLQSYHIEVLAIKVLSGKLDDLAFHIYLFFSEAKKLLEHQLWYLNGYVDNYLSSNDRKEVLRRFDTAISLALSGWHATYNTNNNHKVAIETWRKIFGERFPTYGE